MSSCSIVSHSAAKNGCYVPYIADGDAALDASAYIKLYSIVVDLDTATDIIFAHRLGCQAKLGIKLCEEALSDARKVL